MRNDLNHLFDQLWQQYRAATPSADRIHRLLAAREPAPIVNDHIALRTFNVAPVGLDAIAQRFLELGYRPGQEYHFEAKKLFARHYEHPDDNAPKVFISELLVEQMPTDIQALIHQLVDQVAPAMVNRPDFLYGGRPWGLSYGTYRALATASEYAGWLAAWGYRANHFTVSINRLTSVSSVAEMNALLKDAGFAVNTSGGEVKGSPAELLEQSATLADRATVTFSDRSADIPGCFYEFALRYPDSSGRLYPGFVAASADRIFESTFEQPAAKHRA
ncbi:DUF1338 domain-containing protein [Marinobacter sp. C2H3]|uniref:DUF1338 domain-containing protein n=1 Tax=Marinobacter sp. C2H3 TaxID=3119003 RepID=UPI00300EC283